MIPWIGPARDAAEWVDAVEAARRVVLAAARAGRTITYGELRIAAYEATGKNVGHNQFAQLAMEVDRQGDGCLLSAIIVKAHDERPGDGFLRFARSVGFDATVEALQRQV